MLSVDQRQIVDTFKFRNGMVNIGFVSGFARNLTERGGYIQQTKNVNHMIPFTLDKGDSIPGWVKDGSIVKIVARINGERDKNQSERVASLRVLRFEMPSILELPPEEAWQHSVPAGAPRSEFEPKVGQYGVPFSKRSNDLSIAGFVGGVSFEPPGSIDASGKQSNGCLVVLVQQTKNSDEAIPVRIYGKLSEAHERRIKMGTPVLIQDGELRIRVKPTGNVLEGGVEEVNKFAYIASRGLYIATRDHIMVQPEWAKELALVGQRKNAPKQGNGAAPTEGMRQMSAPADAEGQRLSTVEQQALLDMVRKGS